MVGTGVFTSLGFQVTEIKSVMILLMLWLTGGVIALCGALSYGELASAMPRSGGEYNFLSGIYHPVLGFLAGWVSVLVGFSAPAALAAIAMAKYAGRIIHIQNLSILAIGLIIFLSCIHSYQIKFGGRFQKTVTLLKILVILIFVTAGFTIPHTTGFSMNPMSSDWKQLVSPAYAVSLIFVSYAFSGWNASVYIINEVRKPGKNVPISLISGTLLVTVLYFLLNFIFLYSTPLADLEGNIEIGSISAGHIFGTQGGKIMASIISLLLISSVSAMIWIGPRVSMVMGEDYRIFRFLGKKNRYSVPVRAIWIQALLSIVMILTSTFERVLIYTGFLLNFFTLLSVIGVFILRRK